MRGVAVTGVGLLTPAGTDAETNWKNLCAGRSLAVRNEEFQGLEAGISCDVRGFDPVAELGRRLARRLDRFAHLGLVAARRAVRDAGLCIADCPPQRVGVVIGVGSNSLRTYVTEFTRLGQDRPAAVSPLALPRSVPGMVAGEIALDTGALGPNFTVSSACASGSNALGVARGMLLGGVCDVVLAGGSESWSRMTAVCFSQMRALSRRTDRPGLASRPFDADPMTLPLLQADGSQLADTVPLGYNPVRGFIPFERMVRIHADNENGDIEVRLATAVQLVATGGAPPVPLTVTLNRMTLTTAVQTFKAADIFDGSLAGASVAVPLSILTVSFTSPASWANSAPPPSFAGKGHFGVPRGAWPAREGLVRFRDAVPVQASTAWHPLRYRF
ncbi:CS1 type fimbrial major subunit [Streptomyces sp. NPDC048462]|uniref:CS1 type fimbrial major subunit n=1 Tax=Streptomyces sp. NPDC048462 TaxID=3365555 RepID=UPI00371C2769